MANPAGTVEVDVVPGGGAKFEGLLGQYLGDFGGKHFARFEKMASSSWTKAAAGAGLVTFAAFKMGETFDDAYDTIRVGTGATGKELEGLEKDFKAVVRDVPADFATASEAVSLLNQRLDLTGPQLQARAKQMTELSRITKTDLATNIEQVTRLFGDWSIAGEAQGKSLDYVFRASQASGVGVAEIGELMIRYGAPLRQFGFGFEEAAALMASFQKSGVNTELVMGSMRIALNKLASEGFDDPREALENLIDRVKDAPDALTATAIAGEYFGRRAGADMAAAIREGRFEVDKMITSVSEGKETIRGAGEETQDFSEKMQLAKNRALLAIEPILTRVFDLVGDLAGAFASIPEWAQQFIIGGAALALFAIPLAKVVTSAQVLKTLALGPDIAGIGSSVATTGPKVSGLAGAFSTLASMAGPLALLVGGAIALREVVDGISTSNMEKAFKPIKDGSEFSSKALRDLNRDFDEWKRKSQMEDPTGARELLLEGELRDLRAEFDRVVAKSPELARMWLDQAAAAGLPARVLKDLEASLLKTAGAQAQSNLATGLYTGELTRFGNAIIDKTGKVVGFATSFGLVPRVLVPRVDIDKSGADSKLGALRGALIGVGNSKAVATIGAATLAGVQLGVGGGSRIFFEKGGVVPGRPGTAVPIIAHAGEVVSSVAEVRAAVAQQHALDKMSTSGASPLPPVNIVINAQVIKTDRDLQDLVVTAYREAVNAGQIS